MDPAGFYTFANVEEEDGGNTSGSTAEPRVPGVIVSVPSVAMEILGKSKLLSLDPTVYSNGSQSDANRSCLVLSAIDSKGRTVTCGEVWAESNSWKHYLKAMQLLIAHFATLGITFKPQLLFTDGCQQCAWSVLDCCFWLRCR